MVLSNAQWFANAGVVYEIDESCRFNDNDSAYTGAASPTPTSERIFTFSFWVKRGNLGTDQDIWSHERDDGGNTYAEIMFLANDKLRWKAENTGGANIFDRQTNAVFRDPSAWYHVVCVCDSNQTDSTSADIYVNGVVQTYSSSTNPGSAQDLGWPSTAQPFEVGRRFNASTYLDAYLAHFYFIDGQKLTPSSFGETNSTTGQWVPKEYSGTFGNAGLFLDFSVAPGTGDGAGTDSSGNDNDLTDSGLAANDQMTDTPTDNFCTLNPLLIHAANTPVFTNGNLAVTSFGDSGVAGTIGMKSGKWYWECSAGDGNMVFGIVNNDAVSAQDLITGVATLGGYGGTIKARGYRGTGNKSDHDSEDSYGASFTTEVIGVAFNADIGAIWFSKSNSWQNSATEGEIEGGTVTNAAFSSLDVTDFWFPLAHDYGNTATPVFNFGQSAFAGDAPDGYEKLSTANLPAPTIADPSAYFQSTLYTGNASTSYAINQAGNSTFEPDLLWLKNRDQGDNHHIFDSVRGVTKALIPAGQAETTNSGILESFDSDGFTVKNDHQVNTNTEKYVGWQWLESATSGFDIVSYTGNETARAIAHTLGVVPEFIMVKNREDSDSLAVYHASNTAAPATDYMIFNTTAATADLNTIWHDSVPSTSIFYVGTSHLTNGIHGGGAGQLMIAYLFVGVEGFSKFGSYTGNGSADGPFIHSGFRPAYVMIKKSSATEEWSIIDSVRDPYNNGSTSHNLTHTNDAEANPSTREIDLLSNGFKIRHTNSAHNSSGGTYLYATFAETPFQTANAR